MKYSTASTLVLLIVMLSTTTYSQQKNTKAKFVVKNEWITYDVLSDTIELKRIRPFKKYGLIKTIVFKNTNSQIIYGYKSIPKKIYWTCGTGGLDEDVSKSNFQVLDNGQLLLIEIYASMLSDKSYYYHYIKEFKCEQLTKDKWRLIATKSQINETKTIEFN